MIKKTITFSGVEMNQEIEKRINKILRTLVRYTEESDDSAIVDIEIIKSTNHHRSGNIFEARINFRAYHIDVSAKAPGETASQALDETKRELRSMLQKQKKKKFYFTRRNALHLKNFFKGLSRFRPRRKDDEEIFDE